MDINLWMELMGGSAAKWSEAIGLTSFSNSLSVATLISEFK